jgi:hypothetical protein
MTEGSASLSRLIGSMDIGFYERHNVNMNIGSFLAKLLGMLDPKVAAEQAQKQAQKQKAKFKKGYSWEDAPVRPRLHGRDRNKWCPRHATKFKTCRCIPSIVGIGVKPMPSEFEGGDGGPKAQNISRV